MKKKIINLAIAVALGLVAVYMVNIYIEKNKKSVLVSPDTKGEVFIKKEPVIVAKRDIQKGEAIDKNKLAIKEIPVAYLQSL